MSYQTLYRAFRPRTFREMVGQDAIVRALSNQAATGRIAHAYLFCGSRGTGKTSAARIMSLAINCKNPDQGNPCLACEHCLALAQENTLDVFEMDAASNSRVEEIREMLSKTDYPPQFVPYKVYIIDEVHMLSNAAFNALLKTLEEPPAYMVFILATTEPQKLPATILSRCQRFDFGRITEEHIIARLKDALKDGLSADEGALALIATSAEGSMRDAWSLMDMCLGAQLHLNEASVREALGAVSQQTLLDFLDALMEDKPTASLALSESIIQSGKDVPVFLREFGRHVRRIISLKWLGGDEAAQDTPSREQASRIPADGLLLVLEACMQAEQDVRWASSPRAVLDLMCLRVHAQGADKGEETGKPLPPRKEVKGQTRERTKAQATQAVVVKDVEEVVIPNLSAMLEDKPPKPEEMKPVEPEMIEEAPALEMNPGAEEKNQEHIAAPPLPFMQIGEAAEDGKISPKNAWNAMLESLSSENPGIYSLLSNGKYGGYEGGVFRLNLPKEDSVFSAMLNEESRASVISRLLSLQMGSAVRFVAGDGRHMGPHSRQDEDDEGLLALAKVFGRENIIVKQTEH